MSNRLSRSSRRDYADSQAVTDAARKPSFAEMEEAVADLGQFITVRQDGKGDFTSIQAAIDAAPPNSLIEIQDNGPYNEKIIIQTGRSDGARQDGLLADHHVRGAGDEFSSTRAGSRTQSKHGTRLCSRTAARPVPEPSCVVGSLTTGRRSFTMAQAGTFLRGGLGRSKNVSSSGA